MQVSLQPRSGLPLKAMRSLVAFTLLVALLSAPAITWGQSSSGPSTNASAALAQIANAFSPGKPVSNVQLTGSATWYAGDQDTGTVTFIASASGASQVQLSLAKKGTWTEEQGGIGWGMNCQWAGADGVAHNGDLMNCLKPVVWFLPSISLQPASIPSGVGISDFGIGQVGSGTYRHLRSQAVLPAAPSQLLLQSVQASTVDIGYDPQTLLASALTYQVHPDNGAPVAIPIEIHYSNYQMVNGTEIPFLIQRYVNGSLQLEIQVSSASIN